MNTNKTHSKLDKKVDCKPVVGDEHPYADSYEIGGKKCQVGVVLVIEAEGEVRI